jgi:hypothetical protein
MSKKLYVITSIFNPYKYKSRYDLYRKFKKYVEDSGAELYTIELSFAGDDFEVTNPDDPKNIQLNIDEPLWYKENLLNILISRLPSDWRYMAWIDADVAFYRPDWVEATIKELQHNEVIQMFTHAEDLNKSYESFQTHIGFVYAYNNKLFIDETLTVAHEGVKGNGHPGYAWAATRNAIDNLGGLLDFPILGSADNHMAHALVGRIEKTFYKDMTDNYKRMLLEYQKRCKKYIGGNIGYLKTTLIHYWHGSKKNRGYNTRWKILQENKFDPIYDLKKNSQGLYVITDDKPQLKNQIMRYFGTRDEDS